MSKKNKQTSVTFEPKIEDIIQSLRIDTVKNLELSYNQVINMLVKEALKGRKAL
jgi:hypothetical protein